ncbi:hypothetical protein GCM10028895_19460 [Pontibacter rugosus]
MYGADLALAKEHYAKATPSPFISKDIFLRAEAAIVLKENKSTEAISLAEQAQQQLRNNMDQGAAKAYKAWLSQIILEAQGKAANVLVA